MNNYLLIILCYLGLIVTMSVKGDMPNVSSLTFAEKFVYFYMAMVVVPVFMTGSSKDDATSTQAAGQNTQKSGSEMLVNLEEATDKSEEINCIQMLFSIILGLPVLYLLFKTCV